MKRILSNRDFVSGAFMLVFAAVLFSQTMGAEGETMLFPKIVSLISGVCGGATCVTALRRRSEDTGWSRYLWADAALSVLLFVLCLMAGKLGFYTCMFVVCFAVTGILQMDGRKNLWGSLGRTAMLSLLIMAGMYLIFHVVLSLITPVGMFV